MGPEQIEEKTLKKRFLDLFPNRFDTAFKRADGLVWRQVSRYHRLSDEEIIQSVSEESATIRACCLDTRTAFLVLTVPALSVYRAPEKLKSLVNCLSSLGLVAKAYKAAGSDDIQIYIPFTEAANTARLVNALSSFLTSEMFVQSDETLTIHSERFPFAIPVQRGFAWLDEYFAVKPFSNQTSLVELLHRFISDIESSSVHPSVLLEISAERVSSQSISAAISKDEGSKRLEFQLREFDGESVFEPENSSASVDVEPRDITDYSVGEPFRTTKHGKQLLLFDDPPLSNEIELPDKVLEMGRKARSSLPDEAFRKASFDKFFPVEHSGQIMLPVIEKEVLQTST